MRARARSAPRPFGPLRGLVLDDGEAAAACRPGLLGWLFVFRCWFARPWELHRFHAATHQLVQTAFEETVTRNQKAVKDTHIDLARQINEIQAKEAAAKGQAK